ncbi:hypothetical protein HY798_02370 [Candidatus Falkowbacteria bacterium]|nr:hypothetical protein [Candidatus Falkowbacteria bacterium]
MEWFFPSDDVTSLFLFTERLFHSVTMDNFVITFDYSDLVNAVVEVLCMLLSIIILLAMIAILAMVLAMIAWVVIAIGKTKNFGSYDNLVIPVLGSMLFAFPFLFFGDAPVLFRFFVLGIFSGLISGVTSAIMATSEPRIKIRDSLWASLLVALVMGAIFEAPIFYVSAKQNPHGWIVLIPGAIGVITGFCSMAGASAVIALTTTGKLFYSLFPVRKREVVL